MGWGWSGRLAAVAAFAAASAGCVAVYKGTARAFDPGEAAAEPGWILLRDVPEIRQETESDCGAAALAMMLQYWQAPDTARAIFESCGSPAGGIRAGDLRAYAHRQGLKAFVIAGTIEDLEKELGKRRPVLVGLVKYYVTGAVAHAPTHYEVVVGWHPERKAVVTLDPAHGWRQNTLEGFLSEWEPAGRVTLVLFKSQETPK